MSGMTRGFNGMYRRPLTGFSPTRMSRSYEGLETGGVGSGGGMRLPYRPPGSFTPRGASLSDIIQHKKRPGESSVIDTASGRRLSEEEAFNRMPVGGYQIRLLGGVRGGGRIGSKAGAVGSPGTPTSQEGRAERAFRDGATPEQAAAFAEMPTWQADRATRVSPLDDMLHPFFRSSPEGRREYERIMQEAKGGGQPAPSIDPGFGEIGGDALAPMPIVPQPAPPEVNQWMEENSYSSPSTENVIVSPTSSIPTTPPILAPAATAPASPASGPSPWELMLSGISSAIGQAGTAPPSPTDGTGPMKTSPYGSALSLNDQANKLTHLPWKMAKAVGGNALSAFARAPGKIYDWFNTPR